MFLLRWSRAGALSAHAKNLKKSEGRELALGYEPRHRQQDKHHDDREKP
jgi:hypothetical protein